MPDFLPQTGHHLLIFAFCTVSEVQRVQFPLKDISES